MILQLPWRKIMSSTICYHKYHPLKSDKWNKLHVQVRNACFSNIILGSQIWSFVGSWRENWLVKGFEFDIPALKEVHYIYFSTHCIDVKQTVPKFLENDCRVFKFHNTDFNLWISRIELKFCRNCLSVDSIDCLIH